MSESTRFDKTRRDAEAWQPADSGHNKRGVSPIGSREAVSAMLPEEHDETGYALRNFFSEHMRADFGFRNDVRDNSLRAAGLYEKVNNGDTRDIVGLAIATKGNVKGEHLYAFIGGHDDRLLVADKVPDQNEQFLGKVRKAAGEFLGNGDEKVIATPEGNYKVKFAKSFDKGGALAVIVEKATASSSESFVMIIAQKDGGRLNGVSARSKGMWKVRDERPTIFELDKKS